MARILGTIASSFEALGDFESIATVTVSSGGQSTIEFTSIPSTYKDLVIFISGRFSMLFSEVFTDLKNSGGFTFSSILYYT